MIPYLKSTLIEGNNTQFNSLRANTSSIYFEKIEIKNKNLSKLNFDGVHFSKVTFSGCKLPRSKGTIYFDCIFDGCKFTGDSEASFEKIKFFKGSIIKTELSCVFRDVIFEHVEFAGSSFKGGKLEGDVVLRNNFGLMRSKSLEYTEGRNVSEDYIAKYCIYEKISNWNSLRLLVELPILRVSYYLILLNGVILYAFHFSAINFDYIVDFLNKNIGSDYHFEYEKVRDYFHAASIGRNVISFSSVLIGSLIFNWFCPAEIREYTKSYWKLSLGKREYIYDRLSMKHEIARNIAIIFILTGGVYIVWKYLFSIINIIFVLFSVSII